MEEAGKFRVRWEHQRPTVLSVCSTLLENGKLLDVTLAAEGKRLKAHRLVLSACSPYFELLLTEEYDNYPILFLRDAKFQELEAIVDYMYKGEVDIPQDQLEEFLKLAKALQIKGIDESVIPQQLANKKRSQTEEECPILVSQETDKKQRLKHNLDNGDASNYPYSQSLTQDISSRTTVSVDITMETDMPNIIETEEKILTGHQEGENSRPTINKDNLMDMQKKNDDRLTCYLRRREKLLRLTSKKEVEGQCFLSPKKVDNIPKMSSNNLKIFIGKKAYTMKMKQHQFFI